MRIISISPLVSPRLIDILWADELSFQLSLTYPRGGDKITLRASTPRERHNWMTDIEMASLNCKEAEKRKIAQLKARRH